VSVYYFGANVQVKYYLPEPGSAWVRQMVDEVDAEGKIVNALFTVEISIAEKVTTQYSWRLAWN
jgi:hypothetical protein